MASVPATGRADLTDAQWAVLVPLLPVGVKSGRPPKWGKRQLIDGIRWRVRTGSPWRDVPERYGPWQAVHGLFRRWQRSGVWAAILNGLQARADANGAITWDVSVDATVNRAHQHAAGARKQGHRQRQPPGGVATEPADHGLGRSRGGISSKLHLACEQGQRPLSLLITPGQHGDSPQFQAVLAAIAVPRTGPGRPRRATGPAQAARHTLRLLARRIQHLSEEIDDLNARMAEAVEASTPGLLKVRGVGPDNAAALLRRMRHVHGRG